MSQIIAQNAFRVVEGRPVTTSRIVAECFGKQHQHVMRDIRALISQKPELEQASNFGLLQETVQVGNGGTKKVTIYWMDRKGFSILAMGFTGAKALDFKCAFYDEFERMEKELHKQDACPIATLTPAQQLAIREAVAKRAKDVSANYQTIYRAIYARFQVPRYTEILAKDFDKAIEFIRTVDLTVPTVQKKDPQTETKKPAQILASAEFCEHVRTFVYCWRYLFRKELDLVYKTMRAMESPHAPMLWEAIHDLNLVFLEKNLEEVGYPVKELACYQHWALTHEAK